MSGDRLGEITGLGRAQDRPMVGHVAIVKGVYAPAILQGRKTIEARLMRVRMPPWGEVWPGQWIAFKISSGPFFALARVRDVEWHEFHSQRDVAVQRRRLNDQILGEAEYWQLKAGARFGVFVWLEEVRPIDAGPVFARTAGSRRAWFVLDPALPVARADAGAEGDGESGPEVRASGRRRGLVRPARPRLRGGAVARGAGS